MSDSQDLSSCTVDSLSVTLPLSLSSSTSVESAFEKALLGEPEEPNETTLKEEELRDILEGSLIIDIS